MHDGFRFDSAVTQPRSQGPLQRSEMETRLQQTKAKREFTEIKDTNNSSAKKYVAKMSLRPRAEGRWLHGRADSKGKSVIFFFFGWKKFHSIVLSILMKLN